jgi:hypothetical protein
MDEPGIAAHCHIGFSSSEQISLDLFLSKLASIFPKFKESPTVTPRRALNIEYAERMLSQILSNLQLLRWFSDSSRGNPHQLGS